VSLENNSIIATKVLREDLMNMMIYSVGAQILLHLSPHITHFQYLA